MRECETTKGKKLLIATGCSYKELNIPGEKEFKGKGISYCATCDAKYYEGKDAVVIVGGNSAIEESLYISKFAKSISIINQLETLQALKLLQKQAFNNPKISFLLGYEPKEFIKNDDNTFTIKIQNLKYSTSKTVTADEIFIFTGMKPNLIDDSINTNDDGYIITDEFMHTSLDDIFAAGDVRNKPYRQITTAVSDGTIAAITAAKELEQLKAKVKVNK